MNNEEKCRKIEVYKCTKCESVYYFESAAAQCCENLRCATVDCGNAPEKGYILCADCRDKKAQETQNERIRRAETVTDYDGPCFDHEGNFYRNIEDWEVDNEDSEWLFVAKKVLVFAELSSATLIDRSVEQANVDDHGWLPNIKGEASLSEAIENFKELNEDCCYYELDYSRKFRP
jgi:hypothetical protein